MRRAVYIKNKSNHAAWISYNLLLEKKKWVESIPSDFRQRDSSETQIHSNKTVQNVY